MTSRKKAPKSPAGESGSKDRSPTRPSLDEIRVRAYAIFVERGQTDGQDLDDWYQAEKELTKTVSQRSSG